MSDLDSLYAALQKADAAGDTEGAKKLADYIRSQGAPKGRSFDMVNGEAVPTGSPAAVASRDPTEGMSGFQRFAAGYGAAGVDLARGVGQTVGAVSRQDVADARARDAPLMATTGGKVGHFAGTAADLLPLAFAPGANTVAGATALGATTGALAPSTGTSETLSNAGLGGLGGAGGIVAGRALGVGYNALKSTVAPFFNSGQDAIAARTLSQFAGGPAAATDALANIRANGQNILPGVQPTTAELANNAGLSHLERQLGNNQSQVTAMTARTEANRDAMNSALGKIAGTDSELNTAIARRGTISKPLYDAAGQAAVQGDQTLASIMQRPSMQSAASRASNLAAERGDTSGEMNGRYLQYLKMAMNDMANSGQQMGMGSHELGALKSTLGDLNEWTQANVPSLRAADQAYSTASQPINQMQIGRQLSDKLNPALNDFGNTPRMNANAYASAVRNGDSLAQDVTGNARATLEGTLTPEQMSTINQIGQQLARRANATDLGRAAGSNTSQNLVSQNMFRQIMGPMGLPESWSEGVANSALTQSLMRPAQFIAKAGEQKVLDKVANAALNPVEAQRLLQMNIDPTIAKAIWARQGFLGNLGARSALGYSAQ